MSEVSASQLLSAAQTAFLWCSSGGVENSADKGRYEMRRRKFELRQKSSISSGGIEEGLRLREPRMDWTFSFTSEASRRALYL